MKCIKCGMDLPDNSRYCPGCGTLNERQVTAPPQKRKTRPIIYATAILAAIGLVALIVAIVMAGRGKSVTSASGGTPGANGNVLSAPPGGPGSGGVTSLPPGTPGSGDVTPSSTPKPKPPQAVVDYLNYVKTIEVHRQLLLKDTTQALMLSSAGGTTQSLLNLIDMAGDPDGAQARDPLQDAKDELKRQYGNWLNTLSYFDKKPAPPECREFSAAYRDVLYKETAALGQIWAGFNSVNIMNPQDMQKLLNVLQAMKRDPSIQTNIDTAADTADGGLNKIVSNYDMQKPFDVPREQQTSGNITGF